MMEPSHIWKNPVASLYETDFYTWSLRQAELIRAGRLDPAEIEHVAEEIEALGREQAGKLRSAYRLIVLHLLKLMFQPEMATESWRETIKRERRNILDILDDNPGLKPRRDELFLKAYSRARIEAEDDTGLPLKTFPLDPPFTRDQAEDRGFMPAV